MKNHFVFSFIIFLLLFFSLRSTAPSEVVFMIRTDKLAHLLLLARCLFSPFTRTVLMLACFHST